MTAKTRILALASSLFLIGTTGNAAQETGASVAVQSVAVQHELATREYAARIAEFKAGRSPAVVAIRSNKGLLQTSLAMGVPNAAIEYDQRAAMIESLAKRNLELRTGTRREVTLAKSARLDAMLKQLLEVSGSDGD